jgi:hypothetical protein
MEFNGKEVPDDLNQWSKETFQEITKMFRKCVDLDNDAFSQVYKEKVTDPDIFDKKPNRETIINDDDMTNLKIALGSAETIDDFLRMV